MKQVCFDRNGTSHVMVEILDEVSINYVAQPHRYCDGYDTENYRCRCRGKYKTLRNLPSGHGIELGFFQNHTTISLTLGNLNWQKWVPRDFSKNNLS
jgi:hypothetical protein